MQACACVQRGGGTNCVRERVYIDICILYIHICPYLRARVISVGGAEKGWWLPAAAILLLRCIDRDQTSCGGGCEVSWGRASSTSHDLTSLQDNIYTHTYTHSYPVRVISLSGYFFLQPLRTHTVVRAR